QPTPGGSGGRRQDAAGVSSGGEGPAVHGVVAGLGDMGGHSTADPLGDDLDGLGDAVHVGDPLAVLLELEPTVGGLVAEARALGAVQADQVEAVGAHGVLLGGRGLHALSVSWLDTTVKGRDVVSCPDCTGGAK